MKKILFVDDEPNVLSALQRQLRKQFSVETATGPKEGLEALQNWQDYAVVVADMRMPEMSGVEFLAKVKVDAPDVVRMMLTGNADQMTAIDAINEGHIFGFLNKPCPPEKLTLALEAAMRQHQLIIAEKELLEKTLSGSIKVLSELLAMAEPKSFWHTDALRKNIRLLADHMKVGQPWELEVAAMLLRIGYFTIPPEVVLKARVGHQLTLKEQEMIQKIPAVGGNLLAQIPRLEGVAKTILYQNKRFDGSGFPEDKVAGYEIPIGSRLLKVLFDLSEIESKGFSRRISLDQMRRRTGWYDPKILDAVGDCLYIPAGEGSAEAVKPTMMVSFSNLQIGQLLVSDIQTMDGTLIVAAGNRITTPLIQRLRNFATLSGIKEPIYVEAQQ